jgi:hypothetical protein
MTRVDRCIPSRAGVVVANRFWSHRDQAHFDDVDAFVTDVRIDMQFDVARAQDVGAVLPGEGLGRSAFLGRCR